MTKVVCCPSTEEWGRFLSGELPQLMSVQFADHIDACDGCLGTVQTISPDDKFVQTIAKARELPDSADSEVISQLVDRIKLMKASATNDATVDVSSADSISSQSDRTHAERTYEEADFLAPAQSADELGRLEGYPLSAFFGMLTI